jgi:ABC-type transport system involved in multi-copper enzyme maturation permease subunit
MRGGRAFVVLTIHLFVLSGIIGIIYASYAANANATFGPDPRQAGKAVFTAVVLIQAFVVVFVAPAFTAGAITGEKERQTYDILRTTLLSARSMVAGKLMSALSYVFLMLITAIPLQSVAFFLGGVSWQELVIAQILLALGAITFATMGLYFSAIMRSTLAASVTTFATSLFFTVGIPLLVGLGTSLFSAFLFATSTPPWWVGALLIQGGILLAATNLPATMIVSEIILLEENALWAFQTDIDGHMVWVLSPWYVYIIVYTLVALFFFWLAIRQVNKRANS